MERLTEAPFFATTLATVPPLGLLIVAYILLFKTISKDAVLALVISKPYPLVLKSKMLRSVG